MLEIRGLDCYPGHRPKGIGSNQTRRYENEIRKCGHFRHRRVEAAFLNGPLSHGFDLLAQHGELRIVRLGLLEQIRQRDRRPLVRSRSRRIVNVVLRRTYDVREAWSTTKSAFDATISRVSAAGSSRP